MTEAPGDQPQRLPHGYTNATRWDGTHQRLVVKQYLGPDGSHRRFVEASALRGLEGRYPVPYLRMEAALEIWTVALPGRPGQELLDLDAEAVLASLGRAARRLHALPPPDGWPGRGPIVHGDFGPQNALLDPQTYEVTGVVDWELWHRGDPIEDLAWAEWIVRTHHPDAAGALPALYAGYGRTFAWSRRQQVMLRKCRAAAAFVGRWDGAGTAATALWRDRIAATLAFREEPV